jgi:cephalosporin hydroxylase
MTQDPLAEFRLERQKILELNDDDAIIGSANAFIVESVRSKYSYSFDWLSRPIIQYPQDIVVMQELIWSVKPDLIIETGIAHGGSAVFCASILALLDYADAAERGELLNPAEPRRKVLAIDIDIRKHNRALIEAHPLANRIDMIEGSSLDEAVVAQTRDVAEKASRVLVCLDSNHTADHVLAELEAYAPLTSQGSYCVVFDTVIEDLPPEVLGDRPWGPGNSPKTAVFAYLDRLRTDGRTGMDGAPLHFGIDRDIDRKILISVAPDGFLRRASNSS